MTVDMALGIIVGALSALILLGAAAVVLALVAGPRDVGAAARGHRPPDHLGAAGGCVRGLGHSASRLPRQEPAMSDPIVAMVTTRSDEATVSASSDRVAVRVGGLDLLLTPDAAIRLANQLTDAVDELDGRTDSDDVRGQS